jgi:hypothetical protein
LSASPLTRAARFLYLHARERHLRAIGALERDEMKWIAFALGLGAPLRASRIGVLVSVLLWPWLPIARLVAAGMLGQLD